MVLLITLPNPYGVTSPGSQEGASKFVCVRSILDDIAKPASEIEAAQALLSITTSMEDLKDHLSYDDNLASDDDLSVEGAHSILSRRSNGSKRSQGSRRSDGSKSKRSFGSRHSFGLRQQMARSNLAALLAVKLRKRGDHGLPRAPSSIPFSERPPLTIHCGKSGKSDTNSKEIDIEELDDNDILDPDQEHPYPIQEHADPASLDDNAVKVSPSHVVVMVESQVKGPPRSISPDPDNAADDKEYTSCYPKP